jgi:hypothetical protein
MASVALEPYARVVGRLLEVAMRVWHRSWSYVDHYPRRLWAPGFAVGFVSASLLLGWAGLIH